MPNPLESTAPLIVYVDIKSPYAFVAIEPTLKLEAELGMQFDWRPLTLDIPSYLGSAKKKAGKVVSSSNRSPAQWLSIKYAYGDARRYAQRQGHMLKGTEKIWNSRLANLGIWWVCQQARNQLSAYFDQVYPPFWRRELDIEDIQVVCSCLEAAGVPAQGFAAFVEGEGGHAHDTLMPQLHGHGIYGVPTYIFGEHVMFGREHLPYVKWYLQGAQGAAPDMAYTL